MEDFKKIIEVNGVKMEIDMRTVKVIDQFKVGDNIKVLVKDYQDFKSYIGTIIGFDEFKTKPTIVIAYLKTSYSAATIEFVYYNSASKDVEICALNKWDIPVSKSTVIQAFEKEIRSKQAEIDAVEQKKVLFEELFGKYFETQAVAGGIVIGNED